MEKDKKPHFKPRHRHTGAERGGVKSGGYSCSEAGERKKKNNNK